MEVDISKKVNNVLKFWLPVLVLVAMICAGGIWFLLQRNDVLTIHDAQISCTMVNAKTKAAGTIDEILVEEGDHVEAGDVIARVKVDITEDQIHQLEQTVELAQRNLATIKAGTTVTTPVVSGGGGGTTNVTTGQIAYGDANGVITSSSAVRVDTTTLAMTLRRA